MKKIVSIFVVAAAWLLATVPMAQAQDPGDAFAQLLAGGDPANPIVEVQGDGAVQADTELITVGTLGNDNAYMLFQDNNSGDVFLTFRGADGATLEAWSQMTNGAFTTHHETTLWVFDSVVVDQQSWTVTGATVDPMGAGVTGVNQAGAIFDQAWRQQWGTEPPSTLYHNPSQSTWPDTSPTSGLSGNALDTAQWTIVRIPRPSSPPPNQPLPPGAPAHDSWMNDLQTPQPSAVPTFFPTPRPTPGPTATPFVPPTPVPPPTPPPEPPPANCPPMEISQGDAKITLSDNPDHPVVIGQDKTRRGVDLCVTALNPPVIKTYWTWESECVRHTHEWDPKRDREIEVCVEERWYCQEHQEVYPDPIVMDTVNLGMTLSPDSVDWIEGYLAQRYPGARVKNGSFNGLTPEGGWNAGLRADGTFTLGGCKFRIPVEDPGTWWDSFSATTTGTPYTPPRGLWKRLITRVWLLDTTLIE